MKNALYFFCGIVFCALSSRVFEKYTHGYAAGVEATMQDAYENGVAQVVILEDKTLGFRWIETHKLGYEN